MQLTSDYKTLVMSKLRQMSDGQIKLVKDPLDILAIETIIDYGTDWREGFNVVLNNDKSKIRKDVWR